MPIEYTHHLNGKRCWTNKSLEVLQSSSKIEDSKVRFRILKTLLKKAFKECGDSFELMWDSNSKCVWHITSRDWDCSITLEHLRPISNLSSGKIILKVGSDCPSRPEKDLFPLWGVIREKWQVEHRD